MARPFPLEEGGSANRAFSSPIKAASRAVMGGLVRLNKAHNKAHSESFISFLDGTFSGQVKLRRCDTCQAAEAKLNKEAARGPTFLELALRIRSDIAATSFAAG
jgi:hypothetical protein